LGQNRRLRLKLVIGLGDFESLSKSAIGISAYKREEGKLPMEKPQKTISCWHFNPFLVFVILGPIPQIPEIFIIVDHAEIGNANHPTVSKTKFLAHRFNRDL
jgi:hypothetical protein